METYTASRVLRAIRRGNSWPVVADTAAGPFVVKLRGAAHGTSALVAEIIVAELAEAIGLSVPARVLVDVGPALASDDRNDELVDLLARSAGVNLGFQFLPDARDLLAADVPAIDPDTASRIVWLDWFVANPDRTAQNPNLLVSGGQIWLIDHGSALGFQHNWPKVTEQSPARAFALTTHVLQGRASELDHVHEAMTLLLTREALRTAVRAVPDDFLEAMIRATRSLTTLSHRREAYVAYLWKRLQRARPQRLVAAPA